MKSAFRILGMKKSQWKFLVLKAKSPFDDKYYYFVNKCLSFGAAISCTHFQRVSNAMAHIIRYRAGLPKDLPLNYLDDFLFAALEKLMCDNQLQTFLDTCTEIGFPISMDKTVWGTTIIIFLGLMINTLEGIISILVDKIERVILLLRDILSRKKTTVRQLQKLCGHLNFLCCCIVPGRAFTRRLYAYFSSSMKPYHHIRVNGEMKGDLDVWLRFLKDPVIYCRPFIDFSTILSAEMLFWFTDASGKIGFGGIHDHQWFKGLWPNKLLRQEPSIEFLELYAVSVSVLL